MFLNGNWSKISCAASETRYNVYTVCHSDNSNEKKRLTKQFNLKSKENNQFDKVIEEMIIFIGIQLFILSCIIKKYITN